MPRLLLILLALAASNAMAGPYIPAGDLALRHDIQRLAAAGVIHGPVSTWPMAWGPVLKDLDAADAARLSQDIVDAIARIKQRANWETRTGEPTYRAKLGVADNATRIRSFSSTPRGRAEAGVGLQWTGAQLSADLNVQYVDSASDDEDFRMDGSFLGVALGNWSIAASTQERWWGPGWDGSIILSNNARPIPSLVIDRIFTDAFETRWLKWLGTWDLSVMFGQLEEDRVVPDARFFGMRFSFRPLSTLEIGLSRTAQWCGDGRPCGLSTFADLVLGNDNRGGGGIDLSNEPGNQLGGFDVRWTPGFLRHRVGIYAQAIGEDEAGGFPSRYLGQVGVDWSGYLFHRWSTRAFLEYSGTACQFHESDKIYNCGYNHNIYETGYRYRGNSIGHGADNDAEMTSAGIVMIDADDTQWRALVRSGALNNGGAPDSRNILTTTPQDISSIDIVHSRAFSFGVIELGVGLESIDDTVSASTTQDTRIYVQWRSSY